MNPTKTLPETYTLAWAVDVKKDMRLNLILQFIGIGLFLVAGWTLWQVVRMLRQDYISAMRFGFDIDLVALVILLLAIFIILILHELVHGLFFWIFSKEVPEFGIGPGYAYAAAKDWYFPKRQYLVIGLSPLVILTILGLAAIAIVPITWVGIIFLAVVFNVGGAVGDIYICIRIGYETGEVWIKDKGDGFDVYRQRSTIG